MTKRLEDEYELIVEHSNEKEITIEDIIECVFGTGLEDTAEYFRCKGSWKALHDTAPYQ